MSWLKNYCRASFQLYSGQTLEGFQPLDFFHFYPLWYDLWLEQIISVMDKLDLDRKNFQEIKHLLPTPSSLRAILQKIIPTYRALPHKNIPHIKRVTGWLVRMLKEACPNDPFAENSSPLHSEAEISDIVKKTPWQTGDPLAARRLGQLLAAAGSLTHGLYNDLVTDYGWDAYGPYTLSSQETLLVRHFPDLQAAELWPPEYRASIKELYIYGMYENVDWKIAAVGCHTIVRSGNPITGLKQYAVVADGKLLTEMETETLIAELAAQAEAIYKIIRAKNFEELKIMVMTQECYQFNKLFTAAGLDWRPTSEMLGRVNHKPLLTGLIPHGKMMTNADEYIRSFGVDVFAWEVWGESI